MSTDRCDILVSGVYRDADATQYPTPAGDTLLLESGIFDDLAVQLGLIGGFTFAAIEWNGTRDTGNTQRTDGTGILRITNVQLNGRVYIPAAEWTGLAVDIGAAIVATSELAFGGSVILDYLLDSESGLS